MTAPTGGRRSDAQRRLLAILSNPPTGSGERTLKRVATARDLLGCSSVQVENIFSLPSHASGQISDLGADEVGWLEARVSLASAFPKNDLVLLAHGVAVPTGPARKFHRDQITWMHESLAQFPGEIWQVGDGPRHPSRWQRWTHRAHPGLEFHEALAKSLVRCVLT